MTSPLAATITPDFFTVAFQQDRVTRHSIVSQIRGTDGVGNFEMRGEVGVHLTESFARTAWAIVEQGRSFTEVATTRRWMMTTAMMSFLVAVDDPPNQGRSTPSTTATPLRGWAPAPRRSSR